MQQQQAPARGLNWYTLTDDSGGIIALRPEHILTITAGEKANETIITMRDKIFVKVDRPVREVVTMLGITLPQPLLEHN